MGDLTLRQALDEYKDIYMASRNFAQRTRVEYLNDLDDLIRFMDQLGIRRVGEMGLPQLERYLAELDRRGMAGSTRKRKVVVIRSFLWYLYQDGYLSINLAKRIIPPFAEARSPRYLTKPECKRLLEVASPNPRDFALIQVLLQTGIKLTELTQLGISDVELPTETGDCGSLFVRGGARRKPRIVPLNREACLALRRYLKVRLSTMDSALFINRFRTPLSGRGVEKIVRKHFVEGNITRVNLQSLRHTFGVRLAANGYSITYIQEIMGVSDIRSVAIYMPYRKLNTFNPHNRVESG